MHSFVDYVILGAMVHTEATEVAAELPDSERAAESPWWRDAVVYQVYIRSFADANGDGTGDLAGVRAHLPYLAALGVDALWFNPWYPSPLADAGYDIVDYRSIDPAFGTLWEAEQLIAEARALGIRTIVDIVPEPRLEPAPVVQGGAGCARWIRPSSALLVSARQGRRGRAAAE